MSLRSFLPKPKQIWGVSTGCGREYKRIFNHIEREEREGKERLIPHRGGANFGACFYECKKGDPRLHRWVL